MRLEESERVKEKSVGVVNQNLDITQDMVASNQNGVLEDENEMNTNSMDKDNQFQKYGKRIFGNIHGSHTGFNRRKPGNRFGRLTWARDRSIPKTRPIEVGSSFCDRLTSAWSISICSAYFCCSRYISQERPVQIERFLMGSIDPFEKKNSNFKPFLGIFNIF
ncbi:hypothetical protein YC2023_018119 [Brassica napus]